MHPIIKTKQVKVFYNRTSASWCSNIYLSRQPHTFFSDKSVLSDPTYGFSAPSFEILEPPLNSFTDNLTE